MRILPKIAVIAALTGAVALPISAQAFWGGGGPWSGWGWDNWDYPYWGGPWGYGGGPWGYGGGPWGYGGGPWGGGYPYYPPQTAPVVVIPQAAAPATSSAEK